MTATKPVSDTSHHLGTVHQVLINHSSPTNHRFTRQTPEPPEPQTPQTSQKTHKIMTTLAHFSSQSTSWRESVCGAHFRRSSQSQTVLPTSPVLMAASFDSASSIAVSASPDNAILQSAMDGLRLRGSRTSRKVQPQKSIPNHRSSFDLDNLEKLDNPQKLDKHLPGHRRVNVNELPRPLSRANSMPVFGHESEEEDVVALAISSLEKYRGVEPSHPEAYTAVNSLRNSETQQGTLAMVSPILGKRQVTSQTFTTVETMHQDPDVFQLDVFSTYLSNPRALLKSPPRVIKRKEGFSFTEADLALEMADDESRSQLKALFRQLAVEKKLDQAIAASERAVECSKNQLRKKSVVEAMLSGEAFVPPSPLLDPAQANWARPARSMPVVDYEVEEFPMMQDSDDNFELDYAETENIEPVKPKAVRQVIRAPRRRRESFHTTQPYPAREKDVMTSVGNIPMPVTGNLPTNPNLTTPEAQTLYGQQWLLTQKTCANANPVRTTPTILDGNKFKETTGRVPATWKCAPLKVCEGVLGALELTYEELQTCQNLRLLPVQYLHIKDIVLTTAHHVGFFRKGDARSWFKMDVTKFGRIYDWFEELDWFPWCKGYQTQPAGPEGVECPVSGKVAFGIAGLMPLPVTWTGCLGTTYAASASVVPVVGAVSEMGKPPLMPSQPSESTTQPSESAGQSDQVGEAVQDVEMEDVVLETSGTWEQAGMVGALDEIELPVTKVM